MTRLQPLPRVNAPLLEGGESRPISVTFHRYISALHDTLKDVSTVPADSGVWPNASDIVSGSARLWKNGSSVRLYINDGGTLRFITFS